jgi:hypothetical protein
MQDKQYLLNKIRLLKVLYEDGKIPTLETHEVNPGLDKDDRINYMYFTLPVALNFQRSSPAMWRSALDTFKDKNTNYLFFPEKVVIRTREEIQKDLVKHRLALQPNKHTDIWITICKTLNTYYKNDPRQIIDEGKSDVVDIINILQKKRKKEFPYLSGAKMANYWLYILNHFTDIKLKNLDHISIIPDTHVIQASIRLGLIEKEIDVEKLSKIWELLLVNSGITPVEMHPILWNWSRAKFKPDVTTFI